MFVTHTKWVEKYIPNLVHGWKALAFKQSANWHRYIV